MTKSRVETQKESDIKRGIKPIGFKVPIEFADLLSDLSKESGKSKNIIIMEAVKLWQEHNQ